MIHAVKDAASILRAMGYGPDHDFDATETSDGKVSIEWRHTDPEPSVAAIEDIASGASNLDSGQSYSDWTAENGGDETLTEKRKAQELDPQMRRLLRGLIAYCNDQYTRKRSRAARTPAAALQEILDNIRDE